MHRGKIIARKDKRKVIDCQQCKFKHLYPLPFDKELKEFYQGQYLRLVKRGGRAPEMRRLMKKNSAADLERYWLSSTLFKDIHYLLKKFLKRAGWLVDIGCGTGDCLRYLQEAGWQGLGIEPSEGVSAGARSDQAIYNITLEDFIVKYPRYTRVFDAAILLNVLEHVSDPKRFLKNVKKLLRPSRGIICVRVPNDFSWLQQLAAQKINKTWWVAVPDHINYFDHCSLEKLLHSIGFTVVYWTCDFPMELFLLMGEDYVTHPALGGKCHKKRINFELSLPDDLRRTMYRGLAELGIGRDLLVFAKAKR